MPLKEKEILKKRWDGICEKNQSIYDNHVFIEREYMQFSMQDIYPPMVRLMLPRSFVDLPELLARQKYPSEYRPTVIKTSYDLAVNFAFQYFEQKIKEEEIVTATRYYYGTLQKCYPGYGYLECSEHYRDAEKKHVLAWYSYSNPPSPTSYIISMHLRRWKGDCYSAYLMHRKTCSTAGNHMCLKYLIPLRPVGSSSGERIYDCRKNQNRAFSDRAHHGM